MDYACHLRDEWYENRLRAYIRDYPMMWDAMIRELRSDDYDDCLWMAGSTSYVCSTDGVKWAMDPVLIVPPLFDQLKNQLAGDMGCLDAIFFTHEHGDHYQPELVQALISLPVTWVVPACMRDAFAQNGIQRERILYVNPGDEIALKRLRVRVLPGLHHYDGGNEGVESVGYYIQTEKKRVLFPGDARDFRPGLLPHIPNLDAVFSHVYLSRSNGCEYPFSKYLDRFCMFTAEFDTKKVFLTHLYGYQCGDARLIWTYMNAGAIMDGLLCLKPGLDVTIPMVGKRYTL